MASRVAVVGGGIAGLAAAHKLHESAPDISVALYEAATQVGGIVHTVARDGFVIERSADSFITDPPHALDLCRRLGLADELVPTSSADRRALVLARGDLLPVPEGFVIMSPKRLGPLLRSPVLSLRGRLRVLEEPLVPPRSPHVTDESVANFARRRFGDEAYRRLIQPLVGGIYTGDPERLSMAATMPRFWEAERKHGSLLRAERAERRQPSREMAAESSGARYGMFLSLRRGMGGLAGALMAALPDETVRLRHRVAEVRQDEQGWRVECESGPGRGVQTYDAVIIAVPAAVAARILPAPLSSRLGEIESAGASIVCLGYRREQIAHPLDAFGFVVPQVEGRQILAGSFLSTKFADRAAFDCVLLRIFVGGALQPELMDLSDQALLTLVQHELRDMLGLSGAPRIVEIARWHGAMPQYHVGHVQLVDEVERLAASLPGLALAGNAYRGVGIAPCVKSGEEAAGRVLQRLRQRSRSA